MKKLTEKERNEVEYMKRISEERARFNALLYRIVAQQHLTSYERNEFNAFLDGGYGSQKS